MLARLLHGFGARDRRPAHRCCGRRWRDLPRHRQFVHGEQLLGHVADLVLPCFCGAPAVGWTYSVMGDGQTINGIAVCAVHQEEQTDVR